MKAVMKSPTTNISRFYRPELDVLRLFAFLAVFTYHLIPANPAAAPQFFSRVPWLLQPALVISNAAAIGLPLFYVLSAFLIAELLMDEQVRTGKIHLKDFLVRRMLRIWPLYYLALVIAVIGPLHHHLHNQVFFIGACAVFLGNWSYLIQPIPFENPFAPLWSISLQEQFYLIFPATIKILKGRLVGVVGSVCVAVSFAFLCLEGYRHVKVADIRVNTLSEAIFYGAGFFVAAHLHQQNYAVKNVVRILMLIAAGLIACAASVYLSPSSVNPLTAAFSVGADYASMALACATALFALYRCEWKFPSWMISLGKISYGLFVFHMFSMSIFVTYFKGTHVHDYVLRGSSIILTIVLAKLSYRFIELPFLRLKHRFTFINSRPELDDKPLNTETRASALTTV